VIHFQPWYQSSPWELWLNLSGKSNTPQRGETKWAKLEWGCYRWNYVQRLIVDGDESSHKRLLRWDFTMRQCWRSPRGLITYGILSLICATLTKVISKAAASQQLASRRTSTGAHFQNDSMHSPSFTRNPNIRNHIILLRLGHIMPRELSARQASVLFIIFIRISKGERCESVVTHLRSNLQQSPKFNLV
jgi:hypothetical protein